MFVTDCQQIATPLEGLSSFHGCPPSLSESIPLLRMLDVHAGEGLIELALALVVPLLLAMPMVSMLFMKLMLKVRSMSKLRPAHRMSVLQATLGSVCCIERAQPRM